jgi:general secretion pathway protein B
MSLILDALRKMELERKARRQNSNELRADVLNYRGTAPAAEKPRIISIAAVVLLAFATVAGIFFYARPQPQRYDAVKAAEPLKQEQPAVMHALPAPEPAQAITRKTLPSEARLVEESQELAAKSLKSAQKNVPEGITVSGIAWQDERILRRAVINGALVGEGAEILGAKVIEIRENRVKFNRSGEIFEVDYSSGPGR